MTERNPLQNGKLIGANYRPSDYFIDPYERGDKRFVMSRGALVEFAHCPHRWRAGFTRQDSKATDFGSLLDCLLLTPERVNEQFIVPPKEYPEGCEYPETKGAKSLKPWSGRKSKWGAAWLDDHKHFTVVKNEELMATRNLTDRLATEFVEILEGSQKQVRIDAEYRDGATGLVIPIKTLIDVLPSERSIYDLKTANSAHVATWSKFVFAFGYHVQAALYLDAANAAGLDRIEFFHFGCESQSPFETFKRYISEEFVQLGRATYISALKRYCQCLVNNKWPGYDDAATEKLLDGTPIIAPLPWMMSQGVTDFYEELTEKPADNKDDVGIVP